MAGVQAQLGTDPNSMIPLVLLAAGGYLALTRAVPQAHDSAASTRPVRHPLSLLPQKTFRRVAMEMWGHPRITGGSVLERLSSVKIPKLRTAIWAY